MVFSSILFLFRFMPIAFLIYYLMPRKLKNASLLILSFVFYSWGEVKYFPIMIASILVDYTCSLAIEKYRKNKNMCRLFLIISVVFNLGMLIFFKYTNFFMENIELITGLITPRLGLTLPLGISFYTFQTMSYTIDVYRDKVKAEKNIIDFGAFVVLFPQLIAGPIVKYTDINVELKSRKVNFNQITEGIKLFIFGVGSKVLIANNIGSLWTELETIGFSNISTPLAWIGILAFSFQIYFDFSGYSLMAIGLGKMLGFNFPKNFDFPYISRSITEFWRRWHMTLGSWFREYVYIPMGGNRVTPLRRTFNLLIVWAATGIWHGANWNFLIWGLFFFTIIVIEKQFIGDFLAKHKVFSHIYVIFLLLISWSIFALTDFSTLTLFISRLFSFKGGTDWVYYLRNYAVTFIIAGIFSTPWLKKYYEKLKPQSPIAIIMFAGIFLVSVAYLVDATYNPFLYFRF
ncbi:MAG: MBOAT family O-acyltransferase [Oscillospiraceae bacterium]